MTLEGVASEQILERLQKIYREETVSSDQVEYWARATETNDDRRHSEMTALLPSVDVMADVLAFLTRHEIALQLASVNRRFSSLCHYWCQPEEEKADDDAAAAVPASSAIENVQQQRKLNQGSKSKNCPFFLIIT